MRPVGRNGHSCVGRAKDPSACPSCDGQAAQNPRDIPTDKDFEFGFRPFGDGDRPGRPKLTRQPRSNDACPGLGRDGIREIQVAGLILAQIERWRRG
jgi:hypothetical protein